MIAQMDRVYIKTRPSKAVSRLISYALFEGRPLTTKGQWINPLVFSLFALEKRLPQLKPVKKPIFIVGTGRSGTTILGVVLSMHRDVGFLNEPKALWHTIYPDEDLAGNYTRKPARYRLGAEDVTDEARRSAHRLFGAYLAAVASKRVVDKYPELIFRTSFVQEIFPDARFIFIVRNGWDTCQSIETWSKRLGVQVKGEIHDWWGVNNRKWHLLVDQLVATDHQFTPLLQEIMTFDSHRDMAALEWILTMREGLSLVQECPGIVKMVSYEELTSNPESTLAQVLEFCDLPADEKLFSYARNILTSVVPRPACHLHPAIRPHFEETMKILGYPV
jgi:Sulfotransferase family